MGNRIIRESIRTSDDINDLSWFAEVLFYRLIVSCDDFGRFDARIPIIKATCFPLKENLRNDDVKKALSSLSAHGMIEFYTVEGKPFLQLTAWEHYQIQRNKRSKYPSPEEGNTDCDNLQQVDSTCNNLQQVDTDCDSLPPESESESESENEYEPEGVDARVNEALKEYFHHRQQLKKPLTAEGKKRLTAKLQNMTANPEEQIEILHNSIDRGWVGIFPLNDDGKEKNKSVFDEWKDA